MLKRITILTIGMLLFFYSFSRTIELGQSTSLSGSTGFLGKQFQIGMLSYLEKINKSGGIHGFKLRIYSLDDKYEPVRTIRNVKKLLKKDVFLFIGQVGTPTAKVALPLVMEQKIPFVFAFTGAEFLVHPVNKYVFSFRASYYQETEALVERLTTDLGIKRIAALVQDDAFGDNGSTGIKIALKKRGMSLVAEGRYKRNTVEIMDGYKTISAGNPEAVIIIGAYKPCAGFIKLAKKNGKEWVMATVSFVGSLPLLQELRSKGNNVIISQCVPSPYDESVPIVIEYRKTLSRYAPYTEFSHVSLEGYISAKLLVEIMKTMTRKELTDRDREAFVRNANRLQNLDLGGLVVSFSEERHQANENVYFTVIRNNRFETITNFKVLRLK